ncbi:hypothetical protein SAMN06295967_11445 [Belliella buryatensis]|uniref:Uncharacterized protein n=1 Tax=Belliella buryatensis TaxID=1500549 RepID=A0A239G0W6_9BACT|nr:hypothetical protein SAMN06295967_11445 [Belliella buryatensis]
MEINQSGIGEINVMKLASARHIAEKKNIPKAKGGEIET